MIWLGRRYTRRRVSVGEHWPKPYMWSAAWRTSGVLGMGPKCSRRWFSASRGREQPDLRSKIGRQYRMLVPGPAALRPGNFYRQGIPVGQRWVSAFLCPAYERRSKVLGFKHQRTVGPARRSVPNNRSGYPPFLRPKDRRRCGMLGVRQRWPVVSSGGRVLEHQ